ncbi:MAG: hypothetical protein ABF379_04070 [Akkermansiaceae bacterium]
MSSVKGAPRDEIAQRYQAAIKLAGDPKKGLVVFRKNCMVCRRNGEEGPEGGPDFSTVENRKSSSILLQIPDPSRELLANFMQYYVTRKNG